MVMEAFMLKMVTLDTGQEDQEESGRRCIKTCICNFEEHCHETAWWQDLLGPGRTEKLPGALGICCLQILYLICLHLLFALLLLNLTANLGAQMIEIKGVWGNHPF